MTASTTIPSIGPTEAERFPIGRFEGRPQYSAEERAAHIERLATQPARLMAAVSGFTMHDWVAPYRTGGWTLQQLVHHIADSHLNSYIRLKVGLTEVEATIKPYDQDAWAMLADNAVSPLVSLALFEAVQTRLVAALRGATEADFARTYVHPDNGVTTVDQGVALYAWHGDHHIAHIRAYRATRPEFAGSDA